MASDDSYAGMDLYLTGPDFEAEFGRQRTPGEQAAHELFTAAALLAEPGTSLTAERAGDGGLSEDGGPR